MIERNIEDLWQSVCDGDHEAWRRLVARYAALVQTVAVRAGLSPLDAEDCGQQTWVSLYRNRHKIRDPRGLPAWLIQTTRRKAIRMQQQGRRRSTTERQQEPEQSVRLPDEEVQRLERQAALEHALSMMDKRCQVMLRALFFSDKQQSYKDIAKKLGISVNAMGRARERCLSRLRKILDKIGFEKH